MERKVILTRVVLTCIKMVFLSCSNFHDLN